MAERFDENQDVVVLNEGQSTVYLTDYSSPNINTRARKILPKGKQMVPFKELRSALFSNPGNTEILTEYLTITDPEVRHALGIEAEEIIDNNMIRDKVTLTSAIKIEKELTPFLMKLGPGERERVAQVAIEENVTDIRILTLLERYTPYKHMTDQIREKIEEDFMVKDKSDEE